MCRVGPDLRPLNDGRGFLDPGPGSGPAGPEREARLGSMESSGKETGIGSTMEQAQLESLRLAVTALAGELQLMSERVAELARTVETLAPPGRVAATAGREPRGRAAADAGWVFSVVITPLPEIAMAAVAETSLRGLDGVIRVISVERTGSEARFTLELEPGTDLVSGMRSSMPVPFTVDAETADEIVISLQWAWGRPAAS